MAQNFCIFSIASQMWVQQHPATCHQILPGNECLRTSVVAISQNLMSHTSASPHFRTSALPQFRNSALPHFHTSTLPHLRTCCCALAQVDMQLCTCALTNPRSHSSKTDRLPLGFQPSTCEFALASQHSKTPSQCSRDTRSPLEDSAHDGRSP